MASLPAPPEQPAPACSSPAACSSFYPQNCDLVMQYLLPKLVGSPLPAATKQYFHDADVYADDPETLTSLHPSGPPRAFGESRNWYFFRAARPKIASDGRKPRIVGRGKGTWKPERGEPVVDPAEGDRVGRLDRFTYVPRPKEEGRPPEWLMVEFSLDQELIVGGGEPSTVLCKIYRSPRFLSSASKSALPSSATNGSGGGGIRVENCYVFKSRLQEYAQKAGLMAPEYQALMEGPSYEPIFKSTVLINNAKYESLPGFFSRKAAEQSAAEVALMEISKSAALLANASIPAVQETGLCKNLLQEYAQKMNYAIPSYICNKQASGVGPFICTVDVGGIQYIGATARTKKEAEIRAARTALLAIQGQSEGCANGTTKYIVVPGKRQVNYPEKKPVETPKSLKAKKGRYKKKRRNKMRFIKKNGEAVIVEKDEAIVPGDTHHSDFPMEPAVTTQDQSMDTVMLQPDEGAGRMEHEPASDTPILQPDGEATNVEHESSTDTAMLQAHEEARRVEQEPPSDTPTVLYNKEARSVKQELFNDTAMLQSHEEARRVEQEPPSDTPMVLHNEEARSVKQEPFNDTAMLQSHEEARIVQQEAHTPMVLHNEEARSVNQEPFDDTAMHQPHVEDRSAEPEPPRDAAVVQPNEEPRSVKEEPPIDTAVLLPKEVAKTSVIHASPSDSTIEQPNAEARSIKEEPLRISCFSLDLDRAREEFFEYTAITQYDEEP